MTKRSNMLRVRLSDTEWDKLNTIAQKNNTTMSNVVRTYIEGQTVQDTSADRDHIVALNRINANLSAIAQWATTHKQAASAIEVVAHLIAIQRMIQNAKP